MFGETSSVQNSWKAPSIHALAEPAVKNEVAFSCKKTKKKDLADRDGKEGIHHQRGNREVHAVTFPPLWKMSRWCYLVRERGSMGFKATTLSTTAGLRRFFFFFCGETVVT